MGHLGFNGEVGSVGLTMGLHDHKGLFQFIHFYDSMVFTWELHLTTSLSKNHGSY